MTVVIDPSQSLAIVDDVAVAGTPTEPVVTWTAVPGAAHDELELRAGDGAWWHFNTTAPSVDLRAEAREHGAVMGQGGAPPVTTM